MLSSQRVSRRSSSSLRRDLSRLRTDLSPLIDRRLSQVPSQSATHRSFRTIGQRAVLLLVLFINERHSSSSFFAASVRLSWKTCPSDLLESPCIDDHRSNLCSSLQFRSNSFAPRMSCRVSSSFSPLALSLVVCLLFPNVSVPRCSFPVVVVVVALSTQHLDSIARPAMDDNQSTAHRRKHLPN